MKQDRIKNKIQFSLLPSYPETDAGENGNSSVSAEACGAEYAEEGKEYIFVDAMGNLLKPEFIHGIFRITKRGHEENCFRISAIAVPVCFKNGIGMKEIQLWLGHSNFNTTAKSTLIIPANCTRNDDGKCLIIHAANA
ncbi:MAG: hypothetical protein ACLR7U_12675 [Ruthenibacterium lactatiformans]